MCGGALEEWCRCQRDRRGKYRFIHVRGHLFEEGTVRCHICVRMCLHGVCLCYICYWIYIGFRAVDGGPNYM